MKFVCLLSEGFEDMEAIATVDLLKRADIEIDLVSIYNKKTVTGSYGTKIIADKMMKKVKASDYDGLFIPGGAHSFVIRKEATVKKLVTDFYQQKKWLMAICAAPTVFGLMGPCKPMLKSYAVLAQQHIAAESIEAR